MAAEFICDGCGKRAPADQSRAAVGGWIKPRDWFQRTDEKGTQDACSRECVKLASEKAGTSPVILPI